MTKYCVDRVDRTLPVRTWDRSRNGTALLSARRLIIDLVAGDAGVRTVGADVLLECPRCLNVRLVGAATRLEMIWLKRPWLPCLVDVFGRIN